MSRSPVSIFTHEDGVSAVEFAIIAPVFLLLVFGIICFGIIFDSHNRVQQLAAEAARASVAGLTATERDQLARSYISGSSGAYMLDPSKLSVATTAGTSTFKVVVTYDMSASPAFSLSKLIPMPSSLVRRSATAGNGGL